MVGKKVKQSGEEGEERAADAARLFFFFITLKPRVD